MAATGQPCPLTKNSIEGDFHASEWRLKMQIKVLLCFKPHLRCLSLIIRFAMKVDTMLICFNAIYPVVVQWRLNHNFYRFSTLVKCDETYGDSADR